ncbi:FtsH protease activity modulator HflK [Pseudosulfitobacter sp. DSM 107133]|uniref:FtsH protease activity modulator HflK n=1 Tax=Pseudosulfitobacter sp. DSM 107133 TaxID=2883100 RepID=UPI000DF407AC|nr:FtsH protease activity modulator HflK [Pseudosulfitobacter sp. DSM 107133]UOA26500.1 Modulator of FtsH protease HflK [Pseudosulfitobacter sp. DSM 107133]
MAGNTGGPWGGGGSGGDDERGGNRGSNGSGSGGKPGGGQMPEIDDLVKKGQEQLRVLMGGRGGNNGTGGGRGPGGGGGPRLTRGTLGLGALVLIVGWGLASFYTVKPEERSVELFLGKYSATGEPGLNFAPWPLVTAVVLPVTREQTETIGTGSRGESGLMLTTDENIIDIDFQVVWNISDPAKYLFNLAEPEETIRAVSESAMREVIARSELAPILNRDRQVIADEAQQLIQTTLDQYDSGVNILRLNLDKADPPRDVIDSFREVQAAEQQRDRLEREADAYANRVLAGARGEAAQTLEEAEGYRAQQVNEAQGEAARFTSVLQEYSKAPQVTRKRLYLETMEKILGDVDKIILENSTDGNGGQGVVPYLPLNQLRGGGSN